MMWSWSGKEVPASSGILKQYSTICSFNKAPQVHQFFDHVQDIVHEQTSFTRRRIFVVDAFTTKPTEHYE